MDNPEKLATQGTQDEEKQYKTLWYIPLEFTEKSSKLSEIAIRHDIDVFKGKIRQVSYSKPSLGYFTI